MKLSMEICITKLPQKSGNIAKQNFKCLLSNLRNLQINYDLQINFYAELSFSNKHNCGIIFLNLLLKIV